MSTFPYSSRRVLFLGDSITYAGQYVAFVEAQLRLHGLEAAVEVIDAGLSSETVSGLSEEGHAGGAFPRPCLRERMARVMAMVRPDLVFACYGMNDGIYLPLEEGRFAAYREGVAWLERTVRAFGARAILLTPAPYDGASKGNPAYTAVLERYAAWLLGQEREAGWRVIDLNGPLTRHLAARRRAEPAYALAKDGVHPGEEGHWLMAREVLRGIGAKGADGLETFSTAEAMAAAAHPKGVEVLRLVRERMELLRDAWLAATGHQRPGVRAGRSLAEAQARGAAIGGRIETLLRAGR